MNNNNLHGFIMLVCVYSVLLNTKHQASDQHVPSTSPWSEDQVGKAESNGESPFGYSNKILISSAADIPCTRECWWQMNRNRIL